MLIQKNLTLSLYHLSSSTRYLLRESLENFDLLIYPKKNYGYFVAVDLEDTNLNTFPSDLLYLLRLAHMNDCFYLELDREYPIEDDVLLSYYPPTPAEETLYGEES